MKGKQVVQTIMILFLFFSLVGSLFLQVAATPLVSSRTTSSHTEDSYKKPVAARCDDISYSSIQDAVDHASLGSTIYVNAGIYTEILNINKKINLTGDGKDVTFISPTSMKNSYAIRIAAEGVTLSGFTVTNHGEGLYTTGVKISASHTTIDECALYDTPVGIAIWSADNVISNCEFQGCSDEGIVFLGSVTSECTNNLITTCVFHDNCDGIELQHSSHNLIKDCTFDRNTHAGIDAIEDSNNNNTISHCDFSNNKAFGLYISRSSNTQITHCSFSGNTMMIVGSPATSITNCTLEAIDLLDGSSLSIQGCENFDESTIKAMHSTYTIDTNEPPQDTVVTNKKDMLKNTIISKMMSLFTHLKTILLYFKNHAT